MRSANGKLEHSDPDQSTFQPLSHRSCTFRYTRVTYNYLWNTASQEWDCEIMFGLATSSTHIVHLPPSQSHCPHSAPRHSSIAPSDMLKLPSHQSAHLSLPIQLKKKTATFLHVHKGFKQGHVTKDKVFDFLLFSSPCYGFNWLRLEVHTPGWGAGMWSAPCRNAMAISFQALAAM